MDKSEVGHIWDFIQVMLLFKKWSHYRFPKAICEYEVIQRDRIEANAKNAPFSSG